MKKITSFLMALFVTLGAMAQSTTEAVVKMTWVDYDNATTAIGEIVSGQTARAGYNKISNGQVDFANKGWGENKITYIQVDASEVTGNIIGATLTIEVSGSSDSKRTTGWGIGYNTSMWSADMTYETADRTITTLGNQQWTSTKSSSTFESKSFDIFDAIKNDEDKIITILVYETAAAGGYIKNPKAIVEIGTEVPVTNITLDKSSAEITEGMVMNLLTATVAPNNATDKTVTWTTSDENIATVDGGKVTGVAVGKATITAEANGFKASCEVTVIEKNPKTSWNFTELYTNGKSYGYAQNTIKLGGVDCNYAIGEFEGLALQGADKWQLYKSGGLYNGNGGGRNIAVLNLKAGQIVTVAVSIKDNTGAADDERLLLKAGAILLSQTTTNERTEYTYVMTADGALVLNLKRYFTVFSISSEEPGELAFEEKTPAYTRAIAAGAYGTICLPFAPDAASLENYTFFKMESAADGVISFVEEKAPVANTPYIYCLNGGKEATAITGGVTVVSATMNDVVAGDWTMKGSFTTQSIVTEGADAKYYGYAAAQNKIVKANKTLGVKPYRAYFTAPVDAAAVALRVTRGDETTEISVADLDVESATVIYDLAGRRVEKMERGIYIVNGKKVVK